MLYHPIIIGKRCALKYFRKPVYLNTWCWCSEPFKLPALGAVCRYTLTHPCFMYQGPPFNAVQFQFVRLRLCLWVEDLTLHLITMPDVPQLHLKMTWLYSYWVRSDHEFRIWLPGWEAGLLRSQRKKESEVAQSCPTLCDPMDCSLQRSSIHGIFQARVLECVAISFSRGSS